MLAHAFAIVQRELQALWLPASARLVLPLANVCAIVRDHVATSCALAAKILVAACAIVSKRLLSAANPLSQPVSSAVSAVWEAPNTVVQALKSVQDLFQTAAPNNQRKEWTLWRELSPTLAPVCQNHVNKPTTSALSAWRVSGAVLHVATGIRRELALLSKRVKETNWTWNWVSSLMVTSWSSLLKIIWWCFWMKITELGTFVSIIRIDLRIQAK